jgi:integrase
MSVHKKKDGRWIVQFKDKRTKKLKTVYFGRGFEAEKKAREYNKSLNLQPRKKRTPQEGSAFFSDLMNEYCESKLSKIQNKSLENFMWKMKGVILPELGHIQAIRLTERRIDLYVNKRLKSVKKTTIHRELSDIQAVLNWAVKRKYLAYNPIQNYEKPKRDDQEIRPPSPSETRKIIKCAAAHLVRAICLSYYTGIRPGARELLSRQWHDVDFENKTIFVISARKGGKLKSRNIPLHPDLLDLLYIWHYEDRKFAFKKGNFPDRIIHFRGRAIGTLKTAFKNAKEKAGIDRRIRLYDFRHSFASSALKGNADLKSTSEILGHSRTETTTRIYQHTDLAMHREAIERVPSLQLND